MDVYERLPAGSQSADDRVILSYEVRQKGRFKATTVEGKELRVFLDRGQNLVPGELLKTDCGKVVEIEAAQEPVMTATCDDWHTFARACYHLGNRHVKIEVGQKTLKIVPDYVLQEMLEQLGLTVTTVDDEFVPESGAYSKGHHHHH